MSKPFPLLISTCLMIAGCSGSGSSGNGEDSGIYGLWDNSRDIGDLTDVAYFHLSKDELTHFDYQGDTFDAGENCYLVFRSMVVSLGGAQYSISEGTEIVELVLVNSRLQISPVTGGVERENSASAQGLVVSYPRAEGISAMDLDECE